MSRPRHLVSLYDLFSESFCDKTFNFFSVSSWFSMLSMRYDLRGFWGVKLFQCFLIGKNLNLSMNLQKIIIPLDKSYRE